MPPNKFEPVRTGPEIAHLNITYSPVLIGSGSNPGSEPDFTTTTTGGMCCESEKVRKQSLHVKMGRKELDRIDQAVKEGKVDDIPISPVQCVYIIHRNFISDSIVNNKVGICLQWTVVKFYQFLSC